VSGFLPLNGFSIVFFGIAQKADLPSGGIIMVSCRQAFMTGFLVFAVYGLSCSNPAAAQTFSKNPEVFSKQIFIVLQNSVAEAKDPSNVRQGNLGIAPCNPDRHLKAATQFVKYDVLIGGVEWGGDLVTWGEIDTDEGRNVRFNIAQRCSKNQREMVLRPFTRGVALHDKILTLFAAVLAEDMSSSVAVLKPALKRCLTDGVEFESKRFSFFCHTPTAVAGQFSEKVKAMDYRVFVYSTLRDE